MNKEIMYRVLFVSRATAESSIWKMIFEEKKIQQIMAQALRRGIKMENYKIISNEERLLVKRQLMQRGRIWFEKDPKTAIYLAEEHRESGEDVAALANLYRAIRLGAKDIPQQIIDEYRNACEKTPKEILKSDDSYEGCLELGEEFFKQGDTERAIYYMAFAANNQDKDKYGVAARKIADYLTGNIAYAKQYQHFEALAAKRGNPDLISAFTGRTSYVRQEVV